MSFSHMEVKEVEWQYLKTVFVNTYIYSKQCTEFLLMYNSLMSWTFFKHLIYICAVRHKNVPSNVPVGHIMISLYCCHSSINNSFEIKIGSKENVNSLKTIYFKGRPSVIPHYAEAAFIKTILLYFSHMNFTH